MRPGALSRPTVCMNAWPFDLTALFCTATSCRHIVKLFNQVYKKQVEDAPGLSWLDFYDELLTPDGTGTFPNASLRSIRIDSTRLRSGFNKAYELDGTHMSPDYLPLLERAFNTA